MLLLDAFMCDEPLTEIPRRGARVPDEATMRFRHLRCAIRRLCDRVPVAQICVEMRISPRTVHYWTKLALSYVDEPDHPHLLTAASRTKRLKING